jgi:hypothetical protein
MTDQLDPRQLGRKNQLPEPASLALRQALAPVLRATREAAALARANRLLLVVVVVAALGPLSLLLAHVGRDYGEGWNGYWALAALRGRAALYPVGNIWVANNYLPLWFWCVGWLSRLTGDVVIAGRILALGGTLASAGLCGAIVRRMGAGPGWPTTAVLLLLGYAELPLGGMFAINNPQWLALAAILAALWLLLAPRAGLAAHIGAAGLIALALLTKHNLLALPAAVALAAWPTRPRLAVAWIGGGAVLGGLCLAGLYALFGSALFIEIFCFARTLDLQNVAQAGILLLMLLPLLMVIGLALPSRRADPRWRVLLTFLVLALVNDTAQHLGAGVAGNSHYEALAAAVVLAVALCGTMPSRAASLAAVPTRAAELALLAGLPIAVCAMGDVGDVSLGGSLRQALAAPQVRGEWGELIGDVRATRGQVLCEELAACLWAGRPMGLDFFAYGQKLRRGADPRALAQAISGRRIALLVLDRNPASSLRQTRLPAPFPALIRANYHLIRSFDNGIGEWAPRPARR